MSAPTPLSLAIERLYQVFARYPRPHHVDGCSHCVDENDHANLFAAPLRKLTDEHLGPFAFKVLTTWGEVDDLRHFLPRLFELVATDWLWVDPEVVLGKLRLAEWNAWPPDEQTAVRQYLRALWQEAIERSGAQDTDSGLCAIAQVEDDLSPYLGSWIECPTPASRIEMADFLEWNLPSLQADDTLSNAFWRGRKEQTEQVIRWLRRTEVAGRVIAILQSEPSREALSAAFASWAATQQTGNVHR